jgi:hypothetical protein
MIVTFGKDDLICGAYILTVKPVTSFVFCLTCIRSENQTSVGAAVGVAS